MNEENIIVLLRSGGKAQEAGLKQFYRGYAQQIMRFFVYQGVLGSDAEDVLQETIIKILRNVHTFEGRGEARSWIWQIARNCLEDHRRKMASRAINETTPNVEQWEVVQKTTPGSGDPVAPRPQAVDECVSKGLEVFSGKEPERAAALLLNLDGLGIEEIGVRIGRTSGATKTYLYECRKKLAPYIKHCTEFLSA